MYNDAIFFLTTTCEKRLSYIPAQTPYMEFIRANLGGYIFYAFDFSYLAGSNCHLQYCHYYPLPSYTDLAFSINKSYLVGSYKNLFTHLLKVA
jgi:hypothetical protein